MGELPDWLLLATVIVAANMLYVPIGTYWVNRRWDRQHAKLLADFDDFLTEHGYEPHRAV